jgi:hypothetical protein
MNMSKTEYADYEVRVNRFLAENKVKPGCFNNVDAENPEPYFTWRPCGCCGSRLGGNRERYNFATTDSMEFEAEVCTDCVYYLAYGQLDDMTMMEMENAS